MNRALGLPLLITLSDYEGDWSSYIEAVYQQFRSDFIASAPQFMGRRVGISHNPIYDHKEATFWHCMSEGCVEAERLPDFRRCERIGWIRHLIEAVPHPEIKCWENQRHGKKRIVISVSDFSYVVILAERTNYLLLLTAYEVEYSHQQRKLSREYDQASCKFLMRCTENAAQ